MQLAGILIEWLAGFLLAVEAIKVRNLVAIRDRLAPAKVVERAAIIDLVRTCVVWIMLLFPIIFVVYLASGWDGTGIIGWMIESSPSGRGWAFQIGFAVAGVIVWLSMTWLLGSAIHGVVWGAVNAVIAGFDLIEKNTHNGIVGIFGFVLFSVAMIMKIVEI